LIPPHLRNHGALSQDISVVGVGDHVELWNKETWNSYVADVQRDLPEIAEEVEGL
jgi:MraZ protein